MSSNGAVDGPLLGEQQPFGGVAAFVSIDRDDSTVAPADDVDAGEVSAGGAEGDEQVGVVVEDRVGGLLEVFDRCAAG